MAFSKLRYPRYAIDLSYPAIRYAIAAAITVSGRYAATFPNNGPCLVGTKLRTKQCTKKLTKKQLRRFEM